ncbi:MAG: histidine--tRNA ligase [Leadbetterella sp.]
MSKPSLARGTRDFGSDVMIKRNHIFDTIKKTYQRFGFQPLETPTFENLSVLMGKYGEEGDQLLFKILNSGDFAKDVNTEDWELGSKHILKKVSEKGLRYDLTVPFARYVVMNKPNLVMPFKRYQIQPVWRADRPQKGRYREFYQCDADVVGTDSLICEAEIVQMLCTIFKDLGLSQNFKIKINNRKILTGIVESIGQTGKEIDLCIAIDKLDKIGKDAVEQELLAKGFSEKNIADLQPIFSLSSQAMMAFDELEVWLSGSEIGQSGIQEMKSIWNLCKNLNITLDLIEFDPTLARGLSYYTGAIFEVKALGVSIGSISGGGRYDDLTSTFGMPGVSGVGISLGVDRIYDVLEELNLFPSELSNQSTKILVSHFDNACLPKSLEICTKLRESGINTEIYPEASKLKKQFEYADKKTIPFVLVVGETEIQNNAFVLKNMLSGEQNAYSIEEIIKKIHV